jgi:hypothetical protein
MSDAEKSPDDLFTFRIFRRSISFGEAAHQESDEVGRLLRAAEHLIRSGAPIGHPKQRQLKCRSGFLVADFEFRPGMIRNTNQSRSAS